MEIYEQGIDVSRYQGVIDWQRVYASGKRFAIIRAISSDANGIYRDPNFERNYNGAKAAGLKVGAYYYSYALNFEYARDEIDALLQALNGKLLEYPVFADIEDSTIASLGRQRATTLAKYALDALREKGWYSGLYTYTNFANAYLNMFELSAYPFWVADYRQSVGYTGEYQMWQYSSSGNVSGITTRVDLNNSYVDFIPQLKAGGFNGYEVSAPNMIDVSTFSVEVFGSANCEYFASANVNDVLGILPHGEYKALKASMSCFNGFSWATLLYEGRIVFTALLPDRSILTKGSGCEIQNTKISNTKKDLTALLEYLNN